MLHTNLSFFARLVGAVLLLLICAQPVAAHGEDRILQVENAVAGPYRLTAWTAPGILRAGEIHVETAVLTADSVPRLDVLVQVRVSPLEGAGEAVLAVARPPQNGVIQEAAFRLTEPGSYRVEVQISGVDGERGNVSFPIEVVAVSWMTKWLIYFQCGIAVLAAAWMLYDARRVWFLDKR